MDRCDAYVAVYSSPEPSHTGELTTMRWSGFICAELVQSLFQTILYAFKVMLIVELSLTSFSRSPNIPRPGFVAVTAHCIPTSPSTYIPESNHQLPPLRTPRQESQHTWSLVYSRQNSGADSSSQVSWVLAESVGRWDKRWG